MAKKKKRLTPAQRSDHGRKTISVTRGSGNVFADLGFEDAKELQVKAGLTHQICDRINTLRLTQVQAAKQLAISQPDVSKLMKGRFTGFSADRLIALLNALQVDVDIVIRPHKKRNDTAHGKVRIVTGDDTDERLAA